MGESRKNFVPPQMAADELPGWVRLDALYRALDDAYHPQNPIPDHPADFVQRWASESEHWVAALGGRGRQDESERALRDIADMRLDGKIADFHFYGSDEAQVEAMKERAREALAVLGGAGGRPEMRPEDLAEFFHSTYERLAPKYGYKTRDASAVPWEDVPPKNKALMIDTAQAVLEWLGAGGRQGEERRTWTIWACECGSDTCPRASGPGHFKRRVEVVERARPCGGAAGERPLGFNEVAQRSIDEHDR